MIVRRIDAHEKAIVRELVKEARTSDNQIAKNTDIPLKTVNRKRKRLEEEGLLNYFTYLDTGTTGTGDFGSRQMYVVVFSPGLTRERFLQQDPTYDMSYTVRKHIFESHLGEKNGRLALILIIESRQDWDILEIFNAEIVRLCNMHFGDGIIEDVYTFRLTQMLSMLHNYLPRRNYEGGRIVDSYPDDNIFVADQE